LEVDTLVVIGRMVGEQIGREKQDRKAGPDSDDGRRQPIAMRRTYP
jgi:hypothetical protein